MTTGCAVTLKPVRTGVAVPQGWQQAAGVSVSAAPADLSAWWQTFNDATLSDLIGKALAANHDVRSAQSRLRQARASRRLAGKDLLPSVNGSVSGNTSKSGGDTSSPARALFDAGLDASWEPDIFGGTHFSIQASQADLEATEADLHNTQLSLIAEVARDYVDLRSYQSRLAIATDNLATQTETLQLTSWREQAGLASILDVEQARTNVEQTRAQIPTLETSITETEHRLAVLLGQPPAALHQTLTTPGPVPMAPDSVAVGIPADTLRQRPDVRAAERRLVAETARLGKAETARYPSFSLSGSLGLQALVAGGVSTAITVSSSVAAGLAAPLFDRGRIREQIEIQSAAQEQALIAYEQTMLNALEDVENALVELANARRRHEALAAAAESARTAAQLARDRYTAGLVSYQTVLDTERTQLSAEDSLKSTEADGTSALIRLYKALGGGWAAAPSGEAGTHPQSEAS
jgi:multidrug efflux system outer membrane protein